MAGKFGGGSVWFLVDGYDVLTAKAKQLALKVTSKTEATAGLGDTWDAHTPIGRSMVTLTQGGAYFDTTATTGLHAGFSGSVPSSAQASTRVICVGFGGNTIGAPFFGMEGAFSSEYEVLAEQDGLTKANVGYSITGQRDQGAIVQELEAKTSDWNTKTGGEQLDSSTVPQRVYAITSNSQANPTVVTCASPHGLTTGDAVLISGVSGSSPDINGEQTVTVIDTTTFSVAVNTSAGTGGTGGSFVKITTQNGAVGYQQVTAFSGFSGFIGKIQDSADDVSYADLVTFADVTSGPDAERVEVSGQVDRYLSFDGNVTGTGSITVLAGLCRL